MTQSIPQLPELIADLRKTAAQIADAGHAGWGNSCTNAADALAALSQPMGVAAIPEEWDGKLNDTLQKGLNALYLECSHEVATSMAHTVREGFRAVCTDRATLRHMLDSALAKLPVDDGGTMVSASQPPAGQQDRGEAATERRGLTVSVCHLGDGDDPFVFQCNGWVTAEVLADIDKDLQYNRDTLFPDGPGDYEFNVTRYHGQYGEYGRCELAPGWEFDQIGFEPLAAHGIKEGS